MKNQLLSIEDHYKELRHRVMSSLGSFVLLLIVAIVYSEDCLALVLQLGKDCGYSFVSLSPQEVLLQQLRVALVFSVLVTMPIHLWNICRFVSPAFEVEHSFRKLSIVLVSALIMFVVGMLFAYEVLFPFVLIYLNGMGKNIEIVPSISVEKYTSLFISLTISIGLIFEIPIVCVILTRIGILSSELMKKARGIVTVLCFVIGALITPPDVVSMFIVAFPMVLLYNISIWLCKLVSSRNGGTNNVS